MGMDFFFLSVIQISVHVHFDAVERNAAAKKKMQVVIMPELLSVLWGVKMW